MCTMAFDQGLLKGDVEFPKHPQKQTEDSYDLMRKFSIIQFPSIDSNGRYDKDELWAFLLRIAKIFKWKSYESYTLGAPGNDPNKYSSLSYYRVILGQWVSGHGLQQIISEAIRFKKNNSREAMFIDGKKVDYKECSEHNNIIISEVLSVIDKIILFKLLNYFLKISNAYEDIKGKPAPNDWYEFVEYDSTNKRSIEITKYGFSRESALFIL